jgi:sarcosine oxidase subunit delta
MLLIACPFCGPRDETEFRCGGQSHMHRPGPHDAVLDREWSDYLYRRDNPRGFHLERWLHAGGCRQWFNIARHTVTHEIRAVYAMTDPAPVLGDAR